MNTTEYALKRVKKLREQMMHREEYIDLIEGMCRTHCTSKADEWMIQAIAFLLELPLNALPTELPALVYNGSDTPTGVCFEWGGGKYAGIRPLLASVTFSGCFIAYRYPNISNLKLETIKWNEVNKYKAWLKDLLLHVID